MSDFPIRDVLPELLAALRDGTRALLVAPPGAGKTTMVAPALLDEPWVNCGQILLLVPRRLAARAAAEFIARQHNEQAGETFGYATRLDSNVGKATRVIVMTHGVFLARIQARNVQVYWPEGNVLLDHRQRSPLSHVPDYNAVVTIEPAAVARAAD